jgi:hypothetical protein
MTNGQAVTCEIRYTLSLSELSAFESYARAWMMFVELRGGVHHGYFIPRVTPDGAHLSSPGLAQLGGRMLPWRCSLFPDDQSYRRYREKSQTTPPS